LRRLDRHQRRHIAAPCGGGMTRSRAPAVRRGSVQDAIIDVCIDHRRTLVNRVPDVHGERLFIGCQDGWGTFDAIEVRS
jgi:hypothetical protein